MRRSAGLTSGAKTFGIAATLATQRKRLFQHEQKIQRRHHRLRLGRLRAHPRPQRHRAGAGHGGLLLPKELAIRLDILDYGEVSSKNAWYEEDCQIYVAMMALALNSFYQISDSQIKSAIISITRHNKKYLNSVNFSDYGQAGQRFREIYDSMKEELAVADRERKNKELKNIRYSLS